MKQGFENIQQLAQVVDHQRKAKRDFIADTRHLTMTDLKMLGIEGIGEFQGNEVFNEQLATKLGIPKKYFDLMAEQAPTLLAKNVNHWFAEKPEKRFVRTLDGIARAYLSEKYRAIDNWLVMEAAMKALHGLEMRVESSQITNRRLYLKVVFPGMAQEMKAMKGQMEAAGFRVPHGGPGHVWEEVLSPGLVVSNSEVGCGSVKVEGLVYTFRCTNGAIMSMSLAKYHIGKGFGGGDDDNAREVFTEKTREADDRAFIMKLYDVVKAACDPKIFKSNIEKIAMAGARPIVNPIPSVVEKMADKFDIREDEAGSILNHLAAGGDLTQWGLSSAVTRAAQDVPDYERATDLERLGGDIIEMAPLDWARLVGAN